MIRLAGTALLASTLLAAGCGASAADISAVTSLSGTASSGKTVYDNNCAVCHGNDGSSGSAHRNLSGIANSDASTFVDTVLSGRDDMPGFQGSLSNQQIADLLAYVKTL